MEEVENKENKYKEEEKKDNIETRLPPDAIESISILSEMLIKKISLNKNINNFMMVHNLHFRKVSSGILWLKFKYEDFVSFLMEDDNNDDDETVINLMYDHISWMSFEIMEKENGRTEMDKEELKKMKDLIESKHPSKGFFFVFYIYKNLQNEEKPLILKNDMNFIPSCIKLESIKIISHEKGFKGENEIKKFISRQKKELKVEKFSDEFERKKSNYIKSGKGFTHVTLIHGKMYSFVFKDWK